jgi:Immunoglobulin domain
MLRFRHPLSSLLWALLLVFLAVPSGYAVISLIAVPVPNSTSYKVFVYQELINGPSGLPVGPDTTLLSAISQNGTNEDFEILSSSDTRAVCLFTALTDPTSLSETYSFAGSGWTTNCTLALTPLFQTTPQAQADPAGTNVTLSAVVYHSTGYQWQLDGTNLVESGHYSGVTNAVLTINNATRGDSGTYTVVASNPSSSVTGPSAFFFVYKPIVLSITPANYPAPMELVASNLDGTTFEPDRATNVFFFSSTDLSLSFTNWSLATNAPVVTNGVLQLDLSGDAPSQFWRTVENP